MNRESAATDQALALTLKIGAYSSFVSILAGMIFGFILPFGNKIIEIGFLILLATPGLRIVVAGIQFLREQEFKYVAISAGVLAVIVTAYVLGIRA